MNKVPQPITGPPSSPHPAPSPGLSQPSFPPGPPPSLVFATPQPPQMNPTQQPRQPYYSRASLPSGGGPRGVAPSSAPRPVTPTHVYQMIPQQQLSFPSSPQGPAYFIGQYRSPTYVATPQQYPVPTGTPGFYPGTSPADYTYGAYYSAQPQFTPPVQTAPVIMSPAPQQQQALSQQPSHIHAKRERTPIIIRDPTQGGRDITQEIMSGGRSGSTPTPPQTCLSGSEGSPVVHANGESVPPAAAQVPPDDGDKAVTPDPPAKGDPLLTVTLASDTPSPPFVVEGLSVGTPPPSLAHGAPHPDVMDAPPSTPPEVPAYPAPLPHLIPTPQKDSADVGEGPRVAEAPPVPPSTSNGVVEAQTLTVSVPPHHQEAPLESPIAQPEELRLPNGLPLPAPRDPEAPAPLTADRDDSPIAEPQVEPGSPPPPGDTPTAPVDTPTPPVDPGTPPVDTPTSPVDTLTPPVDTPTPPLDTPTPPVDPGTPPVDTPTSPVDTLTPPLDTTTLPLDTPTLPLDTPTPPVDPGDTPTPPVDTSTPPVDPGKPPTVSPTPLAVPILSDLEAPPPSGQEVPAEPAVEVPLTPPKLEETLPEVAPSVSEEVSEETPPPVGGVPVADSAPEAVATPPPAAVLEEREEPPPQPPPPALIETTMQAAVSVPKKKRKMKDLNKKEAVGDLLDAFKEEQVVVLPEPEPAPEPDGQPPAASPLAQEEAELTWEDKEDKEDKRDAENIQPEPPQPETPDKEYQYKGDQWKPINKEEKKQYDRVFLLGFQFISASLNKPQGLPAISDVVLDKANKAPLRTLDPSRIPGANSGPDFTPSFANLGRPGLGGGSRGPPPGMGMGGGGGGGGPRRSQQMQRKEPRKIIISSMSLNDSVQLNKAEKAWKPSGKKSGGGVQTEEAEDGDPERAKTQDLFKRVRSILNKLTPQKFQQLMKQVTELTIDTEERLKGVIDLTFEKAISEPDFSVAYANLCRCLIGLKVQTKDKPGLAPTFRKLLLNRCQKEFEKDKDDDEIFERKQKEMEAASGEEEKQRLREELQEAKDQARRRSLGNIKFIGELFKLKMLTEVIMHDCIVKLLKNHDQESLECLCRLMSTIGKDLDFDKAKPRMDQYFTQMEKIIKERKTSSRIRFMLQDVLDLRTNGWVPRRGDQGPKTIDQIHKEAELEEHREQLKVQQALISKKDGGPGGGRMGGGGRAGRGAPPQDEGWNTVPVTKNRPLDASRLSKITKNPVPDFNNQLLAPGGKGTWGSWGRGSSGGSSAKAPDSDSGSRPATLNRFSALQQHPGPPPDSDRRVPQRNSSSRDRGERFERGGGERFNRRDSRDRNNRLQVTKRSFSGEKDERGQEREQRGPPDAVKSSVTQDGEKGEVATPPPPTKPPLTEEEVERKSMAIIEEYLHINDMKEAVLCVQELTDPQLLFVFVRCGLESTLERSPPSRESMGLLLHQLVQTGTLDPPQYYKGLQEVLEVAEDMAIDVPHIWLYLAQLVTPMLHEGGLPLGELCSVISKSLVPVGRAGGLLVHILTALCKEMSHNKVGSLWREAGLQWKDLLPEDVDVNKFVTEKNVEFTLGEGAESEHDKEQLSSSEMSKHLDRLLKEKADNQRILHWIEANVAPQQTSSSPFVRVLMTSVCLSSISDENKVAEGHLKVRVQLLQRFLTEEQLELQAVYALQALMVELEQPPNMLQKLFSVLYDEDVIKEETFLKWASSRDPTEQTGKGVALKSVTNFIQWLKEEEEEAESDNS